MVSFADPAKVGDSTKVLIRKLNKCAMEASTVGRSEARMDISIAKK